MEFRFNTAGQIVFGPSTRRRIADFVSDRGSKVLVVTGTDGGRQKAIFNLLTSAGLDMRMHAARGEPNLTDLEVALLEARAFAPHAVLAIGGGSAIDLGKGVAALYGCEGENTDYFGLPGKPAKPFTPSLPLIAVPTTAGTGSEVTANAVFLIESLGAKVSLRHPGMLPVAAIVDPELLIGLPTDALFSSALDALTHNAEAYLSNAANSMTDMFSRQGLKNAAQAIPQLRENPSDPAALTKMALASLYGGIALANGGLGVVHGFASVIGGRYSIPHGAICARLLATGLEANHAVCNSEIRQRIDEIASLFVTDGSTTGLADLIAEICDETGVPRLSASGVRWEDVEELAHDVTAASSYKRNPAQLPADHLRRILSSTLERELGHAP